MLFCRVENPGAFHPDPDLDPNPEKNLIRIQPPRKNRIRIRHMRKYRIQLQPMEKMQIKFHLLLFYLCNFRCILNLNVQTVSGSDQILKTGFGPSIFCKPVLDPTKTPGSGSTTVVSRCTDSSARFSMHHHRQATRSPALSLEIKLNIATKNCTV